MSYRIAVRFSIGGDLRFLSHRDGMRLFERSAIRAGLPLRWGQGFNPRPRFALPLPRPVGVAGDDELLVLELDEAEGTRLDAGEVLDRLARHAPAQVRINSAQPVSSMPRPKWAQYELELDEPPADLDRRIAAVMDSTEHVVQRNFNFEPGRSKSVDIRPYLVQLRWDSGRRLLVMRLALAESGTARPAEVLEALGLPADRLNHRIRRTGVDWNLPAE